MLQTAQIGFATMLGSAEKAQKFLDDMADFAVKTPFEYPELLDAAKKMLAYGFAAEEVLPTLRAVGDAAAALGAGNEGIDRITLALGQIQAKGKLSAEEMRQLTEAGVPAWHMLAEAMGTTVPALQDMVSKGLVPGGKAVEMLTAGMTKRFGGMMASMEDTWQGVTSSIKDIWRMTVGSITQNLFSGVLEWLKGIRDTASNFYNLFSTLRQQGIDTANALRISIAQVFGVDLATAISTLINAAQTAWKILVNTAATIKKHWSKIKPVIVGVASAFLLFKVVPPIVNAVNLAVSALHGTLTAGPALFTFISKAIGIYRLQMHLASLAGITHVGVLESVKIAIYSVYTALGPIGWILLAVAALLGVGTALWNKYTQSVQKAWEASMADKMKAQQEKLKESIKKSAKSMAYQEEALKDLNKAANDNVQSFDEVHQLQEDMAGEDFSLDLNGDTNLMDELFEFDLEGPKTSLSGFWEWIKQGAGNLWEGVKDKWNGFTSWISSWGIWTTLQEKWSGFKEWAGNLWEGVKEKWSGFKEWAGNLWEGVKEKWSGFKEWAGNLWEGVKEKWSGFKEWAGNLWEGVKEKWARFEDWLGEWWENSVKPWFTKEKWLELYQNMKDSIQEKWAEIKDWWENNAFSKWWREDVSPWFTKEKWLELYQNMKDSIQEKWAEIKDWWQNNAFAKWWREDVAPWFTKEKWVNLYDSMKTSLQETWQGIKDWWKNTTLVKWWNEDVAPWFTKEKWVNLYDNMKTSLQETWQGIKDWWKNTTLVKWWNEDVKPWFTKEKWKEVYSTIKDALEETWEEIKNSPKEWGKNLIENFTKGIKEKANSLKDSLKNVGQQIKNFLGFSSPTKEGPGREADKWAPNLMEMYRKGIIQGLPGIRASVSTIAEEMAGLASMTVRPAVRATASVGYTADSGMMSDGIAQAVYRAIIDAFRITQASSTGTSSGESKELVLKIDNTTLARMQLPAIIREGQRQGLNLVVQGV
jgi:tape measure domain-containing protein